MEFGKKNCFWKEQRHPSRLGKLIGASLYPPKPFCSVSCVFVVQGSPLAGRLLCGVPADSEVLIPRMPEQTFVPEFFCDRDKLKVLANRCNLGTYDGFHRDRALVVVFLPPTPFTSTCVSSDPEDACSAGVKMEPEGTLRCHKLSPLVVRKKFSRISGQPHLRLCKSAASKYPPTTFVVTVRAALAHERRDKLLLGTLSEVTALAWTGLVSMKQWQGDLRGKQNRCSCRHFW